MPFWNQQFGQQVWKSESCYLVCTTGASSLYATKQGIARWENNNTANTHVIRNNPNQAVFPGGSARVVQPPPFVALNLDVQQVAIAEFFEEAGIQIVSIANNQFQLYNAVNIVATADRATYYHGQDFHAMILWFNTELDLHNIAAAINWNIHSDNNRYAGANPAPAGGYIRPDDELALVTVANHTTVNWQQLFGTPNQSWFLEIFDDAINM